MQKPEEQKQGAHERALVRLGRSQLELSDLHRPAMAEVLKHAQRDDTATLRARGNADAAQVTANNDDVLARAKRGDAAGLAEDMHSTADLRATALRDATRIAATSRDAATDNANRMLANQTGTTGQGLAQVARLEASDLAQKAQIRQQRRADRIEAASTLASAAVSYGADKYSANKQKAAREAEGLAADTRIALNRSNTYQPSWSWSGAQQQRPYYMTPGGRAA